MLRRIVYISQSQIGSDRLALDSIVEVSNARNAADGITGMLWSDGREFVQALEGGTGEVIDALTRIQNDPRHSAVEIIDDRSVQRRMFGTWSMIQANADVEAVRSTAYLVGFLLQWDTPISRRVVKVLLASEPAATRLLATE